MSHDLCNICIAIFSLHSKLFCNTFKNNKENNEYIQNTTLLLLLLQVNTSHRVRCPDRGLLSERFFICFQSFTHSNVQSNVTIERLLKSDYLVLKFLTDFPLVFLFQPVKNYNEWMLIYFISFMVMSFFLLDMYIGVMVETFHVCRQQQKQSLQRGGNSRDKSKVDENKASLGKMLNSETSSRCTYQSVDVGGCLNTCTLTCVHVSSR